MFTQDLSHFDHIKKTPKTWLLWNLCKRRSINYYFVDSRVRKEESKKLERRI